MEAVSQFGVMEVSLMEGGNQIFLGVGWVGSMLEYYKRKISRF